MKQVLAELHSLINDLEDQGLIAEASSLQDVFIRVAEEAETDDLANDVKAILESHPVAKVLEEIAKQMGGDGVGMGDEDAQTSSFAYRPDSGAGETSGQDVAKIRQSIIDYYKSMRYMQSDKFSSDTKRAKAATEELQKKLEKLNIPFQADMAITPSEMFGTHFETSSFADVHETDGGAGETSGEDEARRAVIEKWSKRFRDKINYFIDENQKNANINWNRSEATRELRENFPNAPEITYEEIAGDDAAGLIQRAIEPSVREQHEDMNRRHPKGDARGYGSWWE